MRTHVYTIIYIKLSRVTISCSVSSANRCVGRIALKPSIKRRGSSCGISIRPPRLNMDQDPITFNICFGKPKIMLTTQNKYRVQQLVRYSLWQRKVCHLVKQKHRKRHFKTRRMAQLWSGYLEDQAAQVIARKSFEKNLRDEYQSLHPKSSSSTSS